MFHTCHWGNAIENSHEIPLHTYQNPEHWQHQMLAKMCSSRNSHSLLVEIQNGYGHFGTQLGTQKLTHGCLLHNSVQFSSISKTWKQPRCPSVHKSPQSCTTLSDPMDCSLPDSSVHGILQARILEQVAMPSSRGSSWPRDWICISYVLHWQADSLPLVPPGKPNQLCILYILEKPTIFPSPSESSFSELSWCLRSPTMWGFPVNKWFSETPARYPTS